MLPTPTVIFDLDGTLVDTAPDLIVAINRTLADGGFQPIDIPVLRPAMSHGARRMIELGLASQGVVATAEMLDTFMPVMLRHYSARVAVDSVPYPLVRETLAEFRARGVTMAVCTNKLEGLSRDLLATLNLHRYFDAICGRDTLPVSKPDPGHLTGTIAMVGGSLGHAIMVGDSEVDIATAQAAGVPIIALAHGYSDADLALLRPDVLLEDFQGFMAAYESLVARSVT
jgi:phosphoglycolate phosphatase